MDLTSSSTPEQIWRTGRQAIVVVPPANLKIQTTGDAGEILLNEGPARGRVWTVILRVEIVETST